MSKGKGVWTACYMTLFDCDKTADAADRFVRAWPDAECPPAIRGASELLVPAFVLRLNLHLLDRLSENGIFRTPKAARFLAIVWPSFDADEIGVTQAAVGAAVLECLTGSGYLEGAGNGLLRLHEYEVHNAKLLGDRARKRKRNPAGSSAEVPRKRRGGSAATPTPTPTPTEDSPPTSESTPATPLKALNDLWLETRKKYSTRWVEHPKIPKAQIPSAQARWKECPRLDLWKLALEAAAQNDWWAGRKLGDDGKPWVAKWENFLREANFHKHLTAGRDNDWRYAGDEELAWNRWFEQIVNGEFEREDFLYEGDWPTDGSLTPKQQTAAEKALRAWWKTEIYDREVIRAHS